MHGNVRQSRGLRGWGLVVRAVCRSKIYSVAGHSDSDLRNSPHRQERPGLGRIDTKGGLIIFSGITKECPPAFQGGRARVVHGDDCIACPDAAGERVQ